MGKKEKDCLSDAPVVTRKRHRTPRHIKCNSEVHYVREAYLRRQFFDPPHGSGGHKSLPGRPLVVLGRDNNVVRKVWGGGDDRKKRKPVRCDRRDPDRRRMRFPLLCCPGPDGLGRATGPIIGDASGERARRHKSGFKKKNRAIKKSISGMETRQTGRHRR